MGRIWSEENRFQKWLEVELAAADTLADAGVVPREIGRASWWGKSLIKVVGG